LRTFSFDFEGEHSEVLYARTVANSYRTRHFELAAGGEQIASQIIRMQRVFDEPMGDSSSIPTYLLAREARRYTKVALTGDGGDELFGGYTWYKPLLWMVREGRTGMFRFVAERCSIDCTALPACPGQSRGNCASWAWRLADGTARRSQRTMRSSRFSTDATLKAWGSERSWPGVLRMRPVTPGRWTT